MKTLWQLEYNGKTWKVIGEDGRLVANNISRYSDAVTIAMTPTYMQVTKEALASLEWFMPQKANDLLLQIQPPVTKPVDDED